MEMRAAGITGTGLYVPEEIRTNDFFNQFDMLPVDDMFDNAGVNERRICADGEKASDLETQALLMAVKNAGIGIEDVELLLNGTNLPDQPQPGNASLVQFKSNAKNAAAINVETACSSLLSQLTLAWGVIRSGIYNTVACVVGANWSVAADYTEKNCMFLGDGAAALIMQPVSDGKGILSTHLETDGRCYPAVGRKCMLPRALRGKDYEGWDYLKKPRDMREKIYFFIAQGKDGIDILRESGPTTTPNAAKKALEKAGYSPKDIDFLITHNPNKYLADKWMEALDVPEEKRHITLDKYGNMSAASIGANLHEAVVMGKITDGDLVVITGPGNGLHHGAVVMRWGK